ncbi:MAG TPA: phosphoribosylanthranilate isomerase [Methanomicrobia archaeon]|nr:phosphoribosylanthranilate isomerase [Methanomicrobia archaeon]
MYDLSVKICGVTNAEDARLVLESGADLLGMIVDVPVASPRKISLDSAVEIAHALNNEIDLVAVMMPRTVQEVERIVRRLEPVAVQLHGFESNAFLHAVRTAVPDVKVIKTVHLDEIGAIHGGLPEPEYLDFLLLDTVSHQLGGTGKTHNWATSARLVEESTVPVLLSGGLSPSNVRDAIRAVKPYGVDVASGVESSPGRKSREKIELFVRNARCM